MKTLLTTIAVVAVMSTSVMARGILTPAPAYDGPVVMDQVLEIFDRKSFRALPAEIQSKIGAHAQDPATAMSLS